MTIDVLGIRGFYGTPLGRVTRRLLSRSIARRWDGLPYKTVIGVGYPTPYLGLFREKSARSLAFMPAQMGVLHWPTARPSKSALIDDANFPLADAAADNLLLVHALENARNAEETLSECYRVLAAGGRMIVIVPNRASLWAREDKTPFGHGRPFSKHQIVMLLEQAGFTIKYTEEALWCPPSQNRLLHRLAPFYERVGVMLNLPLSGVHMVEVVKQVYKPIVPARRAIIVPSLRAAFNREKHDI